jgi:hypothetical protein
VQDPLRADLETATDGKGQRYWSVTTRAAG